VEGDGPRLELSRRPCVFGYGSLVAGRGLPARLSGWSRRWGVAMDNAVDLPGYKCYVDADGLRPSLCVAFLDVAEDGGGAVEGVCVPVDADALARLDARERNYARDDVSGGLVAADGAPVPGGPTRAARTLARASSAPRATAAA